ncbi:MAG: hypothetical protein ACFFCS_15230 [Candidatus Hodarchaeota archaeon]
MQEDQISKGILLPRGNIEQLHVPHDVLGKITTDPKNFLVLFIPRADNLKINIIPCDAPEVLKIQVNLTEFSPQTIKSIAEIIYALNITTIHTSGLCFRDNQCCYEAYVELTGDKEQIQEDIRVKFLKIEGCKEVILETIKTA